MSEEQPPTTEAIMRIATRYLAQRATSTQNLRQVLLRRMRRQAGRARYEPDEEPEFTPLLDDVLARLSKAGLLDDASYAASRARALAAKGLPPWRVRRELADKGLVDPPFVTDALDSDVQARRFAERKRLGPFRQSGHPGKSDKDLRALLRAGFSLQVARRVLALKPEADSANEMNEP